MAAPFRIDVTQEELLEDLCWPGPPPGRWLGEPTRVVHIEHVDRLLARIERAG